VVLIIGKLIHLFWAFPLILRGLAIQYSAFASVLRTCTPFHSVHYLLSITQGFDKLFTFVFKIKPVVLESIFQYLGAEIGK